MLNEGEVIPEDAKVKYRDTWLVKRIPLMEWLEGSPSIAVRSNELGGTR